MSEIVSFEVDVSSADATRTGKPRHERNMYDIENITNYE